MTLTTVKYECRCHLFVLLSALCCIPVGVHSQRDSLRVNYISSIDSLFHFKDQKQFNVASIAVEREAVDYYKNTIKKVFDQNLESIFAKKNTLVQSFKSPVRLNNLSIEYNARTDSSFIAGTPYYYAGQLDMSGNWEIAGVPVSVQYNNQSWSDVAMNEGFFAVRYDRENLFSQLKSKLAGMYQPTDLLAGLKDPLAALKDKAQLALTVELQQINSEFNQLLSTRLQNIPDFQSLLTRDMAGLEQLLLSTSYIRSIREKELLLAKLSTKKSLGEAVDSTAISDLENALNEFKGMKAILQKIEKHKNNWSASGLMDKVKQWEVLKNSQLQELLNDPRAIIRMAKSHLNLSGLQRAMLKLNRLNIGQNVVSSGDLGMNNFLNKGLMSEFLNNNKYLMLLNGKFSDINSIRDIPFTSDIFSSSGLARAISLGKGGAASSHTHLSVSSFDQSFGALNNFSAIQPTWRSLVTTISKQVTIGARGSVEAEVSKSAVNFSPKTNVRDSASGFGNTMQQIFSTDLLSNLAFTIRYENEHQNSGLAYQVDLKGATPEYDNPGNSFLSGGTKELGLRVRKSFLKNKIRLSVRSNIREYRFSGELDHKWRNTNFVTEARWKMSKGQFIQIRYTPNTMTRYEGTRKLKVSEMSRLSADLNITKRMFGGYYRNYFSLLYQTNNYLSGDRKQEMHSIGFSAYQSLTIQKKLIHLNTVYNNSYNSLQYVYLNNSFLAEGGITYPIVKSFSASSAITYNKIKSWFERAGIRQTLNGELGTRFRVNLYVDAGVPLSRSYHLPPNLFRSDISIQYLLNKVK